MSSKDPRNLFSNIQNIEIDKERETNLCILAVNNILNKMNFGSLFNQAITWDEKQWSVTPADLAKSVILLPYLTEERRIPLYLMNQSYSKVDLELIFDSIESPLDLNDDNIGRMLDRFNEADCRKFFAEFSLKFYETFNFDISKILHADTTSHVLYGVYDIESPEECNGPIPKYGHSKAKRNDLLQINQGLIVDGYGLPRFVDLCDGNTTDSTWNYNTIQELFSFMGESISDHIYVADSKFTTKKNFELINGLDHPLSFISRIPDNFFSKVAEKSKNEAFERDQWKDIGTYIDDITNESQLTEYQAYSIEKKIYGQECRLIVYRSTEHKNKIKSIIESDKKQLKEKYKKTFTGKKHIFSCEEDTVTAINNFYNENKNCLHNFKIEVEKTTEFVKPRGRPSKNPKPPREVSTYRAILKEISQNEDKIKDLRRKKSSFVLITNIKESEMEERAVLKTYKEQKYVEDSFSITKKPVVAKTTYLHKPERIEALFTLLTISLLIQVILKLLVRRNLKKLDFVPNLDNHRKPLVNPSSKKIIDMIRNYCVKTSGKNRSFVAINDMFEDGMVIWSYLVGLSEHQPVLTSKSLGKMKNNNSNHI
jgi:transposase